MLSSISLCHERERGYKPVAFAARAARSLQSAGGSPATLADDAELRESADTGAVAGNAQPIRYDMTAVGNARTRARCDVARAAIIQLSSTAGAALAGFATSTL